VLEDHETVRSAEQVAFDLGKALNFSVSDMPLYRKGILPAASCQPLLHSVIQPLLKSAGFTLLPLFVAAMIASSSRHASLSDGLLYIFSTVFQMRDFASENGWFKTILYVAAGLTLLGFGIYFATRIPLDLLADVMAKRVRMAEGRVTSREEEKSTSRDDFSFYYFEMKEHKFQVSRATFVALDSGGLYRVYYLPRSHRLAAIEPAVLGKEAEEKEKRLSTPSVAEPAI